MLDIQEGDILVYGSKEYPIKSCADYTGNGKCSPTFLRQATLTVSTKRATIVEDEEGKRTPSDEPVEPYLKATPFDPVSADLAHDNGLDTPHELLQTFVADSTGYLHLILEDLKR